MSENFLTVEGVTKRYGDFTALNNVSLTVPKGSIYGLLGPNGAGKTTLIRIINQILAADQGQLYFKGEPLQRKHVLQIGYLPEERGLYKKMKVGDQALYFAQLKGIDRTTAQRELKAWFEKLDIAHWWNQKVETLSKGMAQKVQFIITVLHKPELLIFDEPFSGFDPINVNLIKGEILELQKKGTTIIFSTHNMGSVETLCDHITLINASRNVLTGEVNQIRKDYSHPLYELAYTLHDTNTLPTTNALPNGWTWTDALPPEGADHTYSYAKLTHEPGNGSTAQILQWLANENINVHHFSERKESMNSIFIRVVEETKSDRKNSKQAQKRINAQNSELE